MPGFRASGVRCGVKRDGLDLALIASSVRASAAGVFTQSSVVGAPVQVSRARVRRGRARAIVVNSGVANVATGAGGLRDARTVAKLAARALGCAPEEVLVASTGVIGPRLPMEPLRRGVPQAAAELSADGLSNAARAIMTTDTVPKVAFTRTRVNGRVVSVAGVAKGSGMVEPRMATMLAFLVTDAAVAPAYLRRLLREAADESLNRVTVDGETSTSDMALVLANGLAGNTPLRGPSSPGARGFASALRRVCDQLARELARDGEGATKLIRVGVEGARTRAEAERAARRVASSMLVKTAVFGCDPNWGRILQAIGAAGIRVDLSRLTVRLAGIPVFRRGAATGPEAERAAREALAAPEVEIRIQLAVGRARAHLWTCDLSYDYVRINAEYTT